MRNLLDGKTLVIIGDPVEHSLSPLIQQAMLDEMGWNCTYGRLRIPGGSVAEWLPKAVASGLAGFNATMPHKTDLVPLMDTLSEDARLYRSVNTVVIRASTLQGFNTDGEGFLRSLLEEGINPQGRRIAVFGAGGAARSVVLKLARTGAEHVAVCCRTPEKAATLADALPNISVTGMSEGSVDKILRASDLFINCTPLGMEGVGVNFKSFDFLDALPKNAPVCDVIYRPLRTKLLLEAAARGHAVMNGLGMLIHQAILALEYFSGENLDSARMKKAILQKLIPALEEEK